jgi:dienelactone hydrolase
LRMALVSGPTHFAAHVAYYPAGVHGAAAGSGAYTGAPMLMLLGEKDDNLPVAKARDYLAYLEAEGAAPSIETRTYPGAYHAWTVPSLGAPQFYPQYRSTRKCPYLLLGSSRPAVLVDGRASPLDPAAWQACLKEGQGYSMAFDAPTRTRSMHDTSEFLRKLQRP